VGSGIIEFNQVSLEEEKVATCGSSSKRSPCLQGCKQTPAPQHKVMGTRDTTAVLFKLSLYHNHFVMKETKKFYFSNRKVNIKIHHVER
jgi:hypothetical protein